MNRQESKQMNETLLNVYCGILFHAQSFEPGSDISFAYRFDCPEFGQLKAAYPIEKVAGKGGDFERALMDYCFEKPDMGINCVNKAKILVENTLPKRFFGRVSRYSTPSSLPA